MLSTFLEAVVQGSGFFVGFYIMLSLINFFEENSRRF